LSLPARFFVLNKELNIMETSEIMTTTNSVMSISQFIDHWQGHRNLTRKIIEAYPDDQLFTYGIGGMRTFAELVMEMIDLAGGSIIGVATGKWKNMDDMSHVSGAKPTTKAELLKQWDEVTAQISEHGPQLTAARLQEVEVAFGMYEAPNYSTLLYFIDNEIHHRGQGYVYLRSLGVTPPPFWERQ
jgi:uncharacterized damage-inducible protein DinB